MSFVFGAFVAVSAATTFAASATVPPSPPPSSISGSGTGLPPPPPSGLPSTPLVLPQTTYPSAAAFACYGLREAQCRMAPECSWAFNRSNNTTSVSGPAPSGPAPSGPAPSGPAPSGPAPSGPAPSGPAPSGPAPSGPAPSGSSVGDFVCMPNSDYRPPKPVVNTTALEELIRVANGAVGRGPAAVGKAAEQIGLLLLGGAPTDGSSFSSSNVSTSVTTAPSSSDSGVIVAVARFAPGSGAPGAREQAITVVGGTGSVGKGAGSTARLPASFVARFVGSQNSTASDNSTAVSGLVAAHIPFAQQQTVSPPPAGARFSSDVVSFDVYANGQRVNVSNLTEPIGLRIACNRSTSGATGPVGAPRPSLLVKYWDETMQQWRSDGIVNTPCDNATALVVDSGYACANTSHFTAFAVFEVNAASTSEPATTRVISSRAAAALSFPSCVAAALSLLCVLVASGLLH